VLTADKSNKEFELFYFGANKSRASILNPTSVQYRNKEVMELPLDTQQAYI
jgi:hypothetical protein